MFLADQQQHSRGKFDQFSISSKELSTGKKHAFGWLFFSLFYIIFYHFFAI